MKLKKIKELVNKLDNEELDEFELKILANLTEDELNKLIYYFKEENEFVLS